MMLLLPPKSTASTLTWWTSSSWTRPSFASPFALSRPTEEEKDGDEYNLAASLSDLQNLQNLYKKT